MKTPEQERIEELETLVEYWRLEISLATRDIRRETAKRQHASFTAELKSLTVRLMPQEPTA